MTVEKVSFAAFSAIAEMITDADADAAEQCAQTLEQAGEGPAGPAALRNFASAVRAALPLTLRRFHDTVTGANFPTAGNA